MFKRIVVLSVCALVAAGVEANAAKMEFVPAAASGPHAIDGNGITVVGGQQVTLEIKLSDWGPGLLHLFESDVDMAGFTSGDSGTAYPLGWDRPLVQEACQVDEDCPDGQVCFELHHKCAGPDHDPAQGWFVTYSRPDYVFADNTTLLHAIDLLSYRLTDLVMPPAEDVAFSAPSKYAGTLIIDLSDDASGTFTIGFRAAGCFMMTAAYERFDVEYVPATITVVEPGCGNGVCESDESSISCSDDCSRRTNTRFDRK